MHTPSQNEERKTKSRKVLFCSLALIALLVYLRWPRLHENMAYFASSLPNRNTLEREYRMEKPFQLVFKHGKRKIEQKKQDGSWISGTWDNSNERTLPPIKSSYDFIRGEHYVRTTLSAGKLLTITGSDGQSIEVQPITVSNATKVNGILTHLAILLRGALTTLHSFPATFWMANT